MSFVSPLPVGAGRCSSPPGNFPCSSRWLFCPWAAGSVLCGTESQGSSSSCYRALEDEEAQGSMKCFIIPVDVRPRHARCWC